MAADRVRERAKRFAAAMESAGVPYAVIGGNAVAFWIASVEPAAVRNTQDVDVLLRRDDIPRAAEAAAKAGFVHQQVGTDFLHLFRDSPEGKSPRQAFLDSVHVILAGERTRATDPVAAPDVDESDFHPGAGYRVLTLEALVRMKLVAHRLKDRVHLQDMVRIGLIDATWPARYPPELAARLQEVLDDPNG